MVNIGIIGYGYWGRNIVTNFNRVEGAKASSVCDFTWERKKGDYLAMVEKLVNGQR